MNIPAPTINIPYYNFATQNKISTSIFIALLFIALMLSGCQEGQKGDTPADEDGEVIISLTDAEGDFSSYTVDVTSLTLTKNNGAIVNVLPLTTTVDFAQYTEMSEFLTAAMIPNGVYVKASMQLHYGNADIRVENSTGDYIKVESIQDADGNPITTIDVSVHLEGRNQLLIVPGIPAHVTFDFDLNASNQVIFDTSTSEPILTVEPFLLADIQLEKPKIHRLRGPINDVNVSDSQFSIIMRPFRHAHSNDKRFGTLTVVTSEETLYEIDKESYTGSVGLEVLNAAPRFTASIVTGDLKFNPRRFVANEVYAGSSVPGGDMDVANGTVVARSGDILTMKGVTLIRKDGSVKFNDVVSIILSDSTHVKKQLSMETHIVDDISVGQRISVFGNMTNTSNSDLQLDASNGLVRMKISTLHGTTIDSTTIDQSIAVNLQSINKRHMKLFDFEGTGINPASDADPSHYEVNTSTLNVSEVPPSTAVKVKGFVTPFNTAPHDFDAMTIVDLSRVPAIMTMNWLPATASPFISISSSSLILDINGVGLFHHVGRGGVAVNLLDLNGHPKIVPANSGTSHFEIKQNGVRQVFTMFPEFIAEIETRLASGQRVKRIDARGIFTDDDVMITSNMVRLIMNNEPSTEPETSPQ